MFINVDDNIFPNSFNSAFKSSESIVLVLHIFKIPLKVKVSPWFWFLLGNHYKGLHFIIMILCRW